MMESDISVTPAASRRVDGKRESTGSAVVIQCHVETKRRLARNLAGEEFTAEGRCLCDDVYPWVDERCVLVLPNGRTRPIGAVETTYGYNADTDTSGPYQTIIYFT